MSKWQSVPVEWSSGIAIYNFDADIPFKLKLMVGDSLHLLEENDEWFYGYNQENPSKKGVFPKNYVHLKHCQANANGLMVTEPSIATEITNILKEWMIYWKTLYITNDKKNFEIIKKLMNELIDMKGQIISGTLPLDELKQLTKKITEKIDMGNRILGLDLMVRDKNGHLIDPDATSTIQLYYLHKNTTDNLDKNTDLMVEQTFKQYSNIFMVNIKNFTCKMNENAELLITLYDGKLYKPITENYVINWSKDGLMSDLDQIHNLKVIFTDLGKKDLELEKIYLVCYVVRLGTMLSTESTKNSPKNIVIRRPFGVAALDITDVINGRKLTDLEQEFNVPFINCEKDNFIQTLRKIMLTKDFMIKTQSSLFVSMKLFRNDLKQLKEENPHLILGNFTIARKMGFPEVILPGDLRNDLYLTLIKGEFSKGHKTCDKNVEVTVQVCNDKGDTIDDVISMGGGVSSMNEYKSVIYYHEDKPHWLETIKISLPIEEFKTSHLKFFFKHRSSNELKDKNEKPFGMSFVKLMEENGTTLKDSRHTLIVYKIDHKKFDEKNLDYLELPSIATDNVVIKSVNGLIVNPKDTFVINTNICSTKLTQNYNLLGLLNWNSNKANLMDTLKIIPQIDGEEIVKFLQDILDSLFNILMDNTDNDKYDLLVYDCLLYIINLVSNDWKYQHFEPVLDLYIKESFSATLVHKKLLKVLTIIINNEEKNVILFKTMKSMQYVMRFITKSRILYTEFNDNTDNFDDDLRNLLNDIIFMMSSTSDNILKEQGACLKYLPSSIPDLLLVFDPKELSKILCELLKNIQPGRLTKQKMMTINELINSKLFLYQDCRKIMLPTFLRQVKHLFETDEEGEKRYDGRKMIKNRSVAKVAHILGTTQHCLNQHRGYSEEVELCIKILSDLLELLYRKDIGSTYEDINEILQILLRTIIQCHINMTKDNPYSVNLVVILLDVFRQMTETHYQNYIEEYNSKNDLLDFLMEILVVFQELINNPVYPSDWSDMKLLENSIILKTIKLLSNTIRDCFYQKFEYQIWNNFFFCAITFMTQKHLQLELFSLRKSQKICKLYGDMRRVMGFEILAMWFNLGQYKIQFIPNLIGTILDMTLIPENELRKATIPIFFDMMQCEFYSNKNQTIKRNSTNIKANFHEFENEMITKLDTLFEGGKGDENYKELFYDIMSELCGRHTTLKDEGEKFVKILKKLMEHLLEYRQIINNDENNENRMCCTVNLLDFYSEIDRKEMYIRYLNKLSDLHLDCDNYTEAGYTLELYTKLLKWTDDLLSPNLMSNRFINAKTHRQLKEALYYMIIDYFDKGKMWECAIRKCQELARQYEEETYDYVKLAELHKSIAKFYEDIIRYPRPKPEYVRVTYYGRGFPRFLQNKTFIYRGKDYDRLSDFNVKFLNCYPKAELLNKLTKPNDDIINSDGQYLQINMVKPMMDDQRRRFSDKSINEQIINYYKVNDVNRFVYSRPFTRKDPLIDCDNQFAHLWLERTELYTTYPLPGILRWFPVCKLNTHEISPLLNAIETMENTNKSLKKFVLMYNNDPINLQIKPLSLKLNGVLDAAVMGGIKNYEDVFFTDEYLEKHPEDEGLINQLKGLIQDQIPLLELCVQIHKLLITPKLQPLQKRLEDCFGKMQENVVEKYGKGICDIKLDNQVMMRRHYSNESDISMNQEKSTKNHHTSSTILNHKKSFKITREKRRSSKSETTLNSSSISSNNNINSTTHWYMNNNDNIALFELTQELTPKRPLRSEAEKRLSNSNRSQFGGSQYSRPNSLTVTIRGGSTYTTNSGNSSNRDSTGTTDSSVSEEDNNIINIVPPPIPLKSREIDENIENRSFLYSQRNSVIECNRLQKTTIEIDSFEDDILDVPPTPPPKPPKIKK